MTREEALNHPLVDELALFAGGDCGFFDKWRISRHLRSCSGCRAELEGFRAVQVLLRTSSNELPSGLQWDRLSEEMTANIHLGVEAGECVAPLRTPPMRMGWRAAIAMAGVSIALVGAWFLNPLPKQNGEVVMRPAKIELRTTSAGLELNENGSTMVLLHGRGTTQQPAMIVSSPGSLRARYVDSDTGQITINNVYSE